MSVPRTAAAQPGTVPLGTAAQFGLLSGAQLTADATSRAFAFGEAGALGGRSGAIATDSSQYGPGGPPAPVIATALADLATARTWCSSLPGQQALTTLNGATPLAGTYTLTGNVALSAGSRLTLSGDSSSRFVFNISGSLTVEAGAAVVLTGIRPGQVYWNVSGGVTATGPAALAGVVMSGGAVSISSVVASDAAYLSAGAIALTKVSLDGDFSPAYFSAATVLARPKPTPPAPSAAPPCSSLVINGTCEQQMPTPLFIPTGLGNVGSQWANRASEVAFWNNPNEESPDYFGPGGNPFSSVPDNLLNGMDASATGARSGTHYLGVYSVPAPQNMAQVPRREYVWQTLATPLAAGRFYYAEFFSLAAVNSQRSIANLSLTLLPPTVLSAYEPIGPVGGGSANNSVLGSGNYPVLAGRHDNLYNSTTAWSRTAGCFQAQGGERELVVGCFTSDAAAGFQTPRPNAGYAGAYYYLDDIALFAFPQASLTENVVATCNSLSNVTLSVDCALPASANATYQWFRNGVFFSSSTNPIQEYPLATTTYLFQVTVPDPAGGAPTITSQSFLVTVPVQPTANISGPPTIYNNVAANYTGTGSPVNGSGQWHNGSLGTSFTLPAGTTPGTYNLSYTLTAPTAPYCTATAYKQVTVLPYYCEEEEGYDVAIPGDLPLLIDGGGGTYVFSGKRYLVSGNMVLTNGNFISEPGAVFMFEGENNVLTVGAKAEFVAQETRFTSACNTMWGGIVVAAESQGFCLGRSGDSFSTDVPEPVSAGTQNPVSEISHARVAVLWEDPAAEAPVRLLHTALLHNLQGLVLAPAQSKTPVHKLSAVANCVFDSDPSRFKEPASPGTYSHTHLDLDGWDCRYLSIWGNKLSRCMIGVYCAVPAGDFQATIGPGNEFTTNWLAGTYSEKMSVAYAVVGNQFKYAYPSARPNAALVQEMHIQYPNLLTYLDDKTLGVFAASATSATSTDVLTIADNTFVQTYPNTFPVAWAYPQRGIEVQAQDGPYLVSKNTFQNLETGVQLGLFFPGDAQSKVGGNRFLNCNTGISLWNQANPNNPNTWPVFWPQCNTFQRTINSGSRSIGIALADGTRVVFDNYALSNPPAGQQPQRYFEPMKNRFLPIGSSQQTYMETGDAGWAGAGGPRYNAYSGVDPQVTYSINLELDIELGSPTFYITTPNSDPTYTNAAACDQEQEVYGYGFLPRAAPADSAAVPGVSGGEPAPRGNTVAQNTPNPAVDETIISYTLTNITKAELILRDLLTGAVVRRMALAPDATEMRLSVRGLREGVYAYSVVADGVTVGTRRLLVGR